MDFPTNLGALVDAGYKPRTIREEIRANVFARLRAHQPVIDGLVGYEDSVLPELERALVIGHDVIFLGERGQGKTRMIRALNGLLDEWVPIVEGSPLNEDPLNPILASTIDRLNSEGPKTPITWINRAARFSEKLATPDTTIADLIGEVDPIKVAEGRYLGDADTIHYGLVPRTNRGIFAINELPDLPERIQVGLLNALEERDIQIRGYKIALPLDILFVASANPEDYTSRGRLITPLKDRFGTQITTHYPTTVEDEIEIMTGEGKLPLDVAVVSPEPISLIIATMAQLARHHSSISQHSGVSVRASIAAYESVAAAAIVRSVRNDEVPAVVRVTDLEAALPAFVGKIEVESLDPREGFKVGSALLRQAISAVFSQFYGNQDATALVDEVSQTPLELSADQPNTDYQALLASYPELLAFVGTRHAEEETPCFVDLALEGLVATRRLSRRTFADRVTFGPGRD
ncbi:sigma 54-interacting transcriptional regulator [Ferrimicrobium acidiphilum]|jgi:magnesium chelatase subunit I|uniref:Magnesium-chelatase 38 kDa subunit n=1 Tax=Ferrimicrobium acidiphilum DSM 19497 TaxID=1121877 RepID=A0A0D8FSZ9_9ACTN|nr:sigma 54-interacting transcriptional regulator [Ferrimicrobium acidiphilum]KJE76403.1 magnesium-chelatase 38 kDa subunit [Ferrimicrobium acidiphilum DSM 19497]